MSDAKNNSPHGSNGLELLPPEDRSLSIKNGRLIATIWNNQGYVHHAAFDLPESSDDRISLDDLEGVFVYDVNPETFTGSH